MIDQLNLLDWEPKGATYNRERDLSRLSAQMRRVYDVMRDGRRRTLRQLANDADCPEASASARFRDLRKLGFPMRDENMGGGTWHYWMAVTN